ncbi:hypothetical protein [Haloarcula japonica]|uniref:NAD-dependent epimerase/dehydratase n=1 Tax=Haloarcula japonica (strain ATCC 49778 / DSM 6131 / JCM 7785 / NBRC 101032 / NCIMB 13157 / TR-1) TaxID=1227453 RepID=M0LL66_HALJT|nr:hypothetical protein [Haloarcula japonica]EMA32755.1 NAD-dependent epimerase/dehydratase [Haloarcula japonica DSM 6131]
MQIPVTSGAGFIGGHPARLFVIDDHDVVVLNNFGPFYGTPERKYTVELCQNRAGKGDSSYRLAEGDVRDADSSKPSELIGYKLRQAIREGVAESVEWYRLNREWYEPWILEG